MQHRVVIHDPSGDNPTGEIVEGKKAELLVARGIPSLPVDPNLLSRNGVSGYSKREFGRGISLDANSSRRGCSTVLYVMPSHQKINWCARIIPTSAGMVARGRLRLANDTAQVNVIKGGIATAEFAEVSGKLGAEGLTIAGSSRFIANMEGYMGLCLYGTLANARVLWLAISQSKA